VFCVHVPSILHDRFRVTLDTASGFTLGNAFGKAPFPRAIHDCDVVTPLLLFLYGAYPRRFV
jgi:hypothetical protein